ncbi:hypothetical protein B0H15DRAFT_953891 [Mycena belliarum]|uniref:Uncharacterized protein n=1 Tax=Mycena belliarum TaxID=1033014 RepID=A0AAD6XLN7_9AGAR|nr:hypothetical protein B0H15DRAFT_953891 [Mycena belliae]
MTSSSCRCAVPFYPDPGQPQGPLPGQKIYLVTGRKVRFPGAYVSWSSADAQYKNVPSANLKSYKLWGPLEAAWFASCDRGEHRHPTSDTAAADILRKSEPPPSASSSPPGPPSTSMLPALKLQPSPTALRTGAGDSLRTPHTHVVKSTSIAAPMGTPSADSPRRSATRSPLVKPAPSLTAPKPTVSDVKPRRAGVPPARPASASPGQSAAAPPAIAGRMSYAVKYSGGGIVFGDYAEARARYHELQAAGEAPCLAPLPSLTEGVSFVEGFSGASASQARDVWINEEREARAQQVKDDWERAADRWRMKRNGVWTSESDEETESEPEVSDVSSISTGWD